MSRLAAIAKALKNPPKDRTVTGGASYYTSDEWELIHKTYEEGTALTTIYKLLPEPKNKSYKSFKEAYRRWCKHRTERQQAS